MKTWMGSAQNKDGLAIQPLGDRLLHRCSEPKHRILPSLSPTLPRDIKRNGFSPMPGGGARDKATVRPVSSATWGGPAVQTVDEANWQCDLLWGQAR
jgi:hypothetical protein